MSLFLSLLRLHGLFCFAVILNCVNYYNYYNYELSNLQRTRQIQGNILRQSLMLRSSGADSQVRMWAIVPLLVE